MACGDNNKDRSSTRKNLKTKSILCRLASVALLAISVGSRAEASFIAHIYQSGSNVVASGSGTINTAGLEEGDTTGSTGPGVVGDHDGQGALALGGPAWTVQLFNGTISGSTFGNKYGSGASSGSGDPVFLAYGLIGVPVGYTGSTLLGTATFDDTTIADLGLTPGAISSPGEAA